MNQLSQIVSMELNMLNLTMRKRIDIKLYGTLIATIYCSRGMNLKAKFTQKLVDPDYLCTCMNDATIFFFCSRQGDYLLFLAQPHQWSSAEEKHITRSGLPIIIVSSPIIVDEAD